jgi:hypothetical protein
MLVKPKLLANERDDPYQSLSVFGSGYILGGAIRLLDIQKHPA